MKRISLLKNWRLLEAPLSDTAQMFAAVAQRTEGWMEISTLPCDVRMPLIACGKIEEPTTADHSFASEWVERRSWWFQKSFSLTEEEISRHGVELFIEMLDVHADLFLNGSHIGHHASAMYPFCKDVRPFLRVGENQLLIRLTTGLDRVTDEQIAPVRDFVACEFRSRRKGRGDERRVMLRKPQNVFGWDQTPRIATCAISGDVRLDVLDEVAVRDIRFETLELTDAGAKLLVEAEVESRERLFARECEAVFTLEKDGEVVYTAKQSYLSQTGVNYLDFSFTLPDPALWWPNGYGEQPLYTARVCAVNHNGARDEKSIVTGIRTVRLDSSPLSDEERNYTFVINGKRIYCRGMDFIHSDSLYARITDELQEKLLTAAKEANFCMLRFWDGNVYQTDAVYALCNRLGLMVIQNFCFACGAYPDHLEEFRRETEAEAAYQLRRLRSHPSLVMWYGNGENNGLLASYLGRSLFDVVDPTLYPGGTWLYGEMLPRMHHAYVASVPYQCCTPFGGTDKQESEERGDRHYYPFLDLRPEKQQYRISVESFDALKCKFITEGGVMGPPAKEALVRYCGGEEHYAADDAVWEHHRNSFERYAVRDGIYKHYTGERALSLDEYCLYGGLFQGGMLAYEADHIRIQPHCGGSLLWCMNDCFGEVGFSLMDHDGNPKPAYYFLKRAYNANRIVLRRFGDTVKVYATNASPVPYKTTLLCGYTRFDGTEQTVQRIAVNMPAYAPATCVAELAVDGFDLVRGILYAKDENDERLSATLRADDFAKLSLPRKAKLTVSDAEKTAQGLCFTVTADTYAHAVHFGTEASVRFSDLYFDLLPQESRRITVYDPAVTLQDLVPDSVYLS